MASVTVIDQLKKAQILELLEQGKRIDGRALDEPREISIEINAIPKANGSARVYLGDTDVLCGVKIQPDRPFPDMGDKGLFMCTAELLPLSHPTVETGPPRDDVIELARVVDRGIRESHMVDVAQLVIEKDKSVVGVFADIVSIDYDGNLFDACSYAATAALLTSKTPTWEMVDDKPSVVEGGEKQLPITTIPVSVTMAKIGNHIVVDPNGDEWASMSARVTITTDSDGNICALQKGGSDGFTQEEINQCGDLSIKIGAKIRTQLKSTQEEYEKNG
jgi:exosome complex component RRP42